MKPERIGRQARQVRAVEPRERDDGIRGKLAAIGQQPAAGDLVAAGGEVDVDAALRQQRAHGGAPPARRRRPAGAARA